MFFSISNYLSISCINYLCVFFLLYNILSLGTSYFIFQHDKRMNILNCFFIFIHFFNNSISIYQKIILNIFLHLMIYLFILLLNFFLNGSYSSIEIANFLRIFKFLATFLFNVLLASSLNVSHIQYPVIALCLLTALTNSSTPLLYSLCNTFSVPTFFHFLLLLKLMHLSLLLLFF